MTRQNGEASRRAHHRRQCILPRMTHRDLLPRRAFLINAARVAAAGVLTFELELLAGCARDSRDGGAAFAHLTTVEARALRAFASRILPSVDGAPGADEAGAVHFVDRAFGMPFFAELGAAHPERSRRSRRSRESSDWRAMASRRSPSNSRSRSCARSSTTPFFAGARTLVVIGAFADPSYGGNRAGAGWTMLGHRASLRATRRHSAGTTRIDSVLQTGHRREPTSA